MLKDFIEMWKGRDFSSEVLKHFAKIIKISDKMLKRTIKELTKPSNDKKFVQSIYTMDQRVNELQRHIRSHIVWHLAVAPAKESNICLIMMSVVKDAERLGDYTKNILEISQLVERPLTGFKGFFGSLLNDLESYYKKSSKAFVNFDIEFAKQLITEERELKSKCNDLIQTLAAEQEISPNHAVCYTLIAQHCKRIAAHLCNICTAVVMPVDVIDYYDEESDEFDEEEENGEANGDESPTK